MLAALTALTVLLRLFWLGCFGLAVLAWQLFLLDLRLRSASPSLRLALPFAQLFVLLAVWGILFL